MAYQVFVAEDEKFVREGIRNSIEATGKYVLCGEAADGEMALPAILELKPDILITDIKMPFMDGLALSRAVRRAMPWVKILIVSGHDEFEFAKQAISIGVDEYMLKPISAKTLMAALDKISQRLEEDDARRVQANLCLSRDKQERLILRDAFLDRLLCGTVDAAEALEIAARFEMDIPARAYLAAEAELLFDAAQPGAAAHIREGAEEALAPRSDVFWCMRGGDRLALIVKADNETQLDAAVYEIIAILQRRLRQCLQVDTVVGIGSVASRLGEISASYADAHRALYSIPGLPAGTVVNFADMKNSVLPALSASEDVPVMQRLRHMTRQDIGRVMEDVSHKFSDISFNSVLYGYYWIMDLLIAASRLVNELGGDARQVFPELGDARRLLKASASEAALSEIAREILERLITFRDGLDDVKYGDVIARAKAYIYKNYGDSLLSLNTVAAYTGFSPNHFSSIFSQNTGETFIGFLTRVRMEQAKKLLLETEKRSSEVAFEVGYNDVNYFRFLFKKHTGMSARDLRATQGREDV